MRNISLFTLTLTIGLQLALPAVAADYDIYVDKDNKTGVEDGSVDHPYDTITEGIAAALTNDTEDRKVYAASGEYKEQIIVGKYVKLYGKNKNRTIINGGNNKYAVKMKDHSAIKDVRVYKGKTGILIDENAKVKIKNCKIRSSKKIGIEILESNRNDSEKATVEDSKIYKSDGKGLYVKKGKVELIDNKICDNDEEGIDLRAKVRGKIKNNEIYDNGESGIEVIVGKADLKISRNEIKNNRASAISTQFYPEDGVTGDIKIEENGLARSGKYGIDCGNPSGGHYGLNYWNDSIFLIKNTYFGNKLGNHNAICKF